MSAPEPRGVELLVVPWDSGHRDVRMGRGPAHLIRNGLAEALQDDGYPVTVTSVDSDLEPPTEIAVAFDLAGRLAAAVRTAREADRLPLVLAGNCFSAVGILAGLGADRTGALWFDAHGDLNTPDSTRSGFLDGMAAAVATGRCWHDMAATLPGWSPLPHDRLVFLAVRDLDPAEITLLDAGMRRLRARELRAAPDCDGTASDAARELLASVAADVDGFYVHVDLDVLDPDVASVNAFPSPGGLDVADVEATIAAAAQQAPIRGAALTAFDPAYDDDGRATAAAISIARALARAAQRPRTSASTAAT